MGVCIVHIRSSMILFLVLVSLFGATVSSSAVTEWSDLRCTFSKLDILRIDSFFQLPRTLSAARTKGWQKPGETISERHITTLCEKNDARICLLYDDRGSLAGYQIAIPRVVDALRMPGLDYERMGLTAATLFEEQWYTARVFFVPQDTITSGGRTWDGMTGLGLWLPINGRLQEIPRKEADLQSKIPLFKKQNCYKKMGQHYFYNMSRTAAPQDLSPFFILYSKSGDLIGWGFNAFGADAAPKSVKEYIPFVKKRSWFEYVPASKVRDVAPDTPDWALEYLSTYGYYSHHVYMVPDPWKVSCD